MSAPDLPPTEPTPSVDAGSLDRLGAAMDAFLRFRDGTVGRDREAFLARHEQLRDLLEPMLEDADEELEPAAAVPDPAGLQPGRQVGDYRIVREVGRGGMGIVFEAEQISLRRRVALKLLHPHLAWEADSIERFRREATAAAGLRHPAIVPIHEVGEWRGLHFFSMEFVDGRPLQQLVHAERFGVRDDCSRPAEAAELITRVADALQHAHEHGLVHRDVKPHNIMIGAHGAVHLLDFGLVKNLAVAQQSATGAFLGTPHYCSPEQATPGAEVGPRTDVFSLAIVLYELLARRRPFDGESTRVVLQRIEQGEFESLRRSAPSAPRDLVTICHKALERDPAARYATAGEFAADLRRFLRIEPILARPPGNLIRGMKWIRRHRMRVALAATASLLLLGTPIAFALHEHDTAIAIGREREVLDRAEHLGFRSIERTLELIGEQLERQPGPPASHRSRVDDVVRLCEEFLALRAEDPKRRERVARALYVTSFVYAKLGQLEAGMAACQRALQIVATTEPGTGSLADIAASLQRRRIFLNQGMHPETTDEDFERETTEWQRLAKQPDGDDWTTVEYCQLLLQRARVLADHPRQRLSAERLLRRLIELLPPALCTKYERAGVTSLTAKTVLGQVLLMTSRAKEASELLEPTLQQLGELEPTPLVGIERARAMAAIGEAQERLGQDGAAEDSLQKAIAAARELVTEYPGVRSLRRTLIRSRVQLGSLLIRRNRSAEAEPILRAAGELASASPPESWLDRSLRVNLDMQLANCILLKSKGQDRQEARRLLHGACEMLEQLVAEQPEQLRFSHELGCSLSNLAGIANDSGDYREAAELAARAVAQQRSVLAAEPENRQARSFLGLHYSQLAFAHAHLGEHASAIEAALVAIESTPQTVGSLRLAAEAACLSAEAITQDVLIDEAERKACAERYARVAMSGLRRIAALDRREASRWLTAPRFAFLSNREDMHKLAEEVKK